MDITDKIDAILDENISMFMSKMSKGLNDVQNVTSNVARGLWHYLDPKMKTGVSFIYRSQPSKKVMDELWYRVGKKVEDSELLTDDGLKKLKKNFYGFQKQAEKMWKWNSSENRWE